MSELLVDLWQPHLLPLAESEGHDPVPSNLVFAGRASDVRDVWVKGEQCVANGRLTGIDEAVALEQINAHTIEMLERREKVAGIPMVMD